MVDLGASAADNDDDYGGSGGTVNRCGASLDQIELNVTLIVYLCDDQHRQFVLLVAAAPFVNNDHNRNDNENIHRGVLNSITFFFS